MKEKEKMFLVGSQADMKVFVECTLACVCVCVCVVNPVLTLLDPSPSRLQETSQREGGV